MNEYKVRKDRQKTHGLSFYQYNYEGKGKSMWHPETYINQDFAPFYY